MIFIFGKSIIFWSGIILGFFFFLNFLTCLCLPWSRKIKIINKHHKFFSYGTVVFGLIHTVLALLSSLFGILI